MATKPSAMIQDPNLVSAKATTFATGVKRVSAGDPAVGVGVGRELKTRGTGAATKGTKSRGPMA